MIRKGILIFTLALVPRVEDMKYMSSHGKTRKKLPKEYFELFTYSESMDSKLPNGV